MAKIVLPIKVIGVKGHYVKENGDGASCPSSTFHLRNIEDPSITACNRYLVGTIIVKDLADVDPEILCLSCFAGLKVEE